MTVTDFDIEGDFGITEIVPGKVYISDLYNAIDEIKLRQYSINATLNVSHHAGNNNPEHSNIWVPLNDGAGNTQQEFDLAVDNLFGLINEDKVVLVHCLAGMSRSVSVVTTWYAKVNGITFDEAVVPIKERRVIASPHYELRKLARKYLKEEDFWFGGKPE